MAEKPSVNIDFTRPPPGFPSMNLPPPFGLPNLPPPGLPPQMLLQPPPMVPDHYGSEFLPGPGAPPDDYFNQYNEPTQDSQWGSQVIIKVLLLVPLSSNFIFFSSLGLEKWSSDRNASDWIERSGKIS